MSARFQNLVSCIHVCEHAYASNPMKTVQDDGRERLIFIIVIFTQSVKVSWSFYCKNVWREWAHLVLQQSFSAYSEGYSHLAVIIGGVHTSFNDIEERIDQPFTATHLPSCLLSSWAQVPVTHTHTVSHAQPYSNVWFVWDVLKSCCCRSL